MEFSFKINKQSATFIRNIRIILYSDQLLERPKFQFNMDFNSDIVSGQNGKYLHFSDEGFCANGDEPVPYFIELRDPTRICIKTEAGRYLNSEKNGAIVIGDANAQRATEWEY